MKEKVWIAVFLIGVFSLILVSAAGNDTQVSKLDKGFKCLSDQIGNCDSISVQELSLTILATPDDKFEKCVNVLKAKKSNSAFGSLRDTALAVLALRHAGINTKDSEDWLLKKTIFPKDLIWYIEVDPKKKEETKCTVSYDSKDYSFTIDKNKKLKGDFGNCLSLAHENFWIQVSDKCYEKEFSIKCDKDYVSALIYKNKDSEVVYVLDNTQSASADDSVKWTINSKCFGENSCDYEGSLWASFALFRAGRDIKTFIPYLTAGRDVNQKYLPDAFLYMLTSEEEFASLLINSQSSSDYWKAKNSPYGRYYDTALALISLHLSNSKNVENAKEWLLKVQHSNGCWGNVRDTAIVLWALANKAGRTVQGKTEEYCKDAGFFCVSSVQCPDEEKLSNYFCAGTSVCCKNQHLKSCKDQKGKRCGLTEKCLGNVVKASDTDECCIGECSNKTGGQTTECADEGYTCRDSCGQSEEEVYFDCGSGEVCCKEKTSTNKEEGGSSIVWILIVLIIIIGGIIAWLKREQLKVLWFKIKSRFGKDKGHKGGGMPPRGPPRYPMPPPRMPPRMQPRPSPVKRAPARRPLPAPRSAPQKTEEDPFKKLREMSK